MKKIAIIGAPGAGVTTLIKTLQQQGLLAPIEISVKDLSQQKCKEEIMQQIYDEGLLYENTLPSEPKGFKFYESPKFYNKFSRGKGRRKGK